MKIINLKVPSTYLLDQTSKTPDPLILDCEYEVDENEKGFVLKWLLDNQPVYQWIPSKNPFPFVSLALYVALTGPYHSNTLFCFIPDSNPSRTEWTHRTSCRRSTCTSTGRWQSSNRWPTSLASTCALSRRIPVSIESRPSLKSSVSSSSRPSGLAPIRTVYNSSILSFHYSFAFFRPQCERASSI